jgi:hypothetical protein
MATTELARRTTAQVDPADAARLSKSKLVPEHLANDAASAEYMMRIAAALGLEPINAFQHIFVFPDGKGRLRAGMSAHLMHALAVAAGHELHIEGNATQATAVLVRHTTAEKLHRFQMMREEERRGKLALLEDTQRLYTLERDQIRDRIEDLKALAEMGGDGIEEEIKGLRQQLLDLSGKYDFDELRKQVSETKFDLSKLARFESTWTIGRATKAGLNTKDVWQSYGPEMLKARAKVSVIRDGAIDVILGIKHIMGDLGLEFSGDVDDEMAVSNVLYTPEELGADVDQDGVPLKGRVVNVTAAGASKTQDRLVATAMKLIDGKSAEEIQRAVTQTMNHPNLGDEDKISRLDAINKAVQQAGRGGEEVSQDDGSCELSTYLDGRIHELSNV